MLELKQITKEDIRFLYDSYLEYIKYLNDLGINLSEPSFEEHEKFVKKFLYDKKNHSYKNWYIVYFDSEKIGNFNLKKNNEFGYQIINKYQGKGFGTLAFEKFFEIHPKKLVWARSKIKNTRSHSILKKFGFCVTDYEFHINENQS